MVVTAVITAVITAVVTARVTAVVRASVTALVTTIVTALEASSIDRVKVSIMVALRVGSTARDIVGDLLDGRSASCGRVSANQVVHKGDMVINVVYKLLQYIILWGLANNKLDIKVKRLPNSYNCCAGSFGNPKSFSISVLILDVCLE